MSKQTTEQELIESAQQELDIITSFANNSNPFEEIISAHLGNLSSIREEEDISPSTSLSPILSEGLLTSDRKNSDITTDNFLLGDEKEDFKALKKPQQANNSKEFKVNSVVQIIPEYTQEPDSKHKSLHSSVQYLPFVSEGPEVPVIPVTKEVSASKEAPVAKQVKEVPVTKKAPDTTGKPTTTKGGLRTSSKVSSTTTVVDINTSSTTTKKSSTADQVIMTDQQPNKTEAKESRLRRLLGWLLLPACCIWCRKRHQKNKQNEQSLPLTSQPEVKVTSKNEKRRGCLRTCCWILIIIIILLLLGTVILLVTLKKSPAANNSPSNSNTTNITNTTNTNNTPKAPTVCLITFDGIVSSAQAKTFSCDVCSLDDSFYNITTFCVLKGIWANALNATVLENQGWLGSGAYCKWFGVTCDNSGNIIGLFLQGLGIPKILTDDIGKLITLKQLTIMGTVSEPSGPFPNGLAQLVNLQVLNIQFTNLSSLPDIFDKLTLLENLTSSQNPNLGTSLPQSIGTLFLSTLVITGQRLTGNIPDFIGNSKSLQSNLNVLDLSQNSFTGPIPSSLSQLKSLTTLSLELNNLTSQIPDFSTYASAKSLRNLLLDSNDLTGQIPTSISALTNLVVLQLQKNQLSGNIPSQIGTMNNLQQLNLNQNSLSGSIPDSVAALHVQNIDLSANALSGPIPSIMCQNNYAQCDLASNSLTISGKCGVCLT